MKFHKKFLGIVIYELIKMYYKGKTGVSVVLNYWFSFQIKNFTTDCWNCSNTILLLR